MLFRPKVINRNQRGFTLIEVLAATAITGLIGVGIVAAIFQVLNVNALSTNHVTVLKQVESALHWLSRDAQMAQTVQPSGESGFPLSLSWVEWDNTKHQVSYTLENSKLYRSHSVNGGEPSRAMVAEHINTGSDVTNCQFANRVLTLKVTASVGGFRPARETGMAQVIPRPAP